MIYKNDFENIISNIVSECPQTTVLDSDYKAGKDNWMWFSYTFETDKDKITEFKQSEFIEPGMYDEIWPNNCEYDEAYDGLASIVLDRYAEYNKSKS